MVRIRRDASSRLPIEEDLAAHADEVTRAVRAFERAVHARKKRHVELCARTHFSFLAGGSSPEKLVIRANELGCDAIGVTDRFGFYGIVRAHVACKENGLRLVVGAEVETVEPAARLAFHVENQAGYTNLCRILTAAHANRPRDDRRLARAKFDVVLRHAEGLFVTLHAPYDERVVRALHAAFGERFSLAVTRPLDGTCRSRIADALGFERRFGVRVLATNDVRFAEASDKAIYDVLHCIREGITLEDAGRSLLPNAELALKDEAAMEKLFELYPSWIERSRTIADACTFVITDIGYRFPYEISSMGGVIETPTNETADEALRRLTCEGSKKRYPEGVPPKVQAQIEMELGVICEMNVAPYFLSVREIVEIAKRREILCQGRGSAANSAVCYCLEITAVDPTRVNMLFERFLSKKRAEPPDIDVDFEHERREEVIQEVYERYGRDRAAMVSEVICYRGKSGLRDVGKVFGLSLEQTDRLSGLLAWFDGPRIASVERLVKAGFDPSDERLARVCELASKIQGYPRHLSIHVGGFVLSAAPLCEVAPIEPATMIDRTVVPWDKDDIEVLGFFKMDVLGLGMLSALRRMLDFTKDAPLFEGCVRASERLARIPEDPKVYETLCKADTVGVFQIESRAQMAMLPRLAPKEFYDLVVEVAIVRPGPIQGGMVHPYLRRRAGEEKPEPPHPILGPILERTLGVPLFQEQVMQIAIEGAGYSGDEADQLRRDMAAWKKNGNLGRHEKRLLEGFRKKGIDEVFAKRLFAQIQGFGEYGFPESHAASFALLAYASAWLKVHHPAAFAAALVNSQPMGFYTPSTIFEDAVRHGVEVRPIRVESSAWDCTLEDEHRAIRVGFCQIKGLDEAAGRRIEAARRAGEAEGRSPPFESIEDLGRAANLDDDALSKLAEAGALEALVHGRRAAIWTTMKRRPTNLFETSKDAPSQATFASLSRMDQLRLDYDSTGFSVCDHPMKIVRDRLPRGTLDSRTLLEKKHGSRVTTAGLVICRQRPMTASGVVFMTLEDEFGFVNLVLWSRTFDRWRDVATGSSLLLVKGKVERDANVVHVVVSGLEPIAWTEREDFAHPSRDFH